MGLQQNNNPQVDGAPDNVDNEQRGAPHPHKAHIICVCIYNIFVLSPLEAKVFVPAIIQIKWKVYLFLCLSCKMSETVRAKNTKFGTDIPDKLT